MAGISFFDSKECEWVDMEAYFSGAKTSKLAGLRYKASKEKKLLHGSGDQPLSVQGGNRMYEGQIKVLKSALDQMNLAARAAGGQDILDISFDIVVTYRAQGARPLQVDTLVGVEVSDFEIGWDQGADHMEVTLPIMFLRLVQA